MAENPLPAGGPDSKQAGSARIQKTGPGRFLLLAGLCLGVYLFAPFFPLQFLSLFAFFIILGSRLYSEYLLRSLKIHRRDPEIRCFRFEWAAVELTVENRGLLPAFMLALGDRTGEVAVFRNHKKLCTLPGRSRLIFAWQAYCSERGIGSLGPAQLRCADPLGLFPFSASPGETTRLVVYPAPGMIGLDSPGGIPLGKLPSRNPLYEDMTRRRSLRQYRRGDEPRRINWKASIRLQAHTSPVSLLVNEYEAAISYPLVVFLNLDPYEYDLQKRELWFERAIEAAAALCLMASRDRQDLGIIFYRPWTAEPCTLIKPGPFTLLPILERLAGIKRPRGPAGEQETGLRGSVRALLDQGKRLPYGTRLVYTGPELPEEDYAALNVLRAGRISLEYLVLDEKRLGRRAPGNAPRYQMREGGYEIL
ncbi:MAG: DUF58 domain-containing protein [Treponema sp.]|jgi:uncharacterized protein (DUF58 family)|nr:DUF58 domain-containing protein [Treponema sp.]